MSSGAQPSEESPARRTLTHFYVGVVLGLLTIVLTALLHGLAPVAALDRLGEDWVQRIYAGGRPPSPTGEQMVLLDIDFSTDQGRGETSRLTSAVRALTEHHPRAIVIDQRITDLVPEGVATEFLTAVRDAAAKSIQIVLVPSIATGSGDSAAPMRILPGWVNGLRKTRDVVIASPVVYPDPDGVIRSVPRADCFLWPGETNGTPLPSLAASLGQSPPASCRRQPDVQPIRYLVSWSDMRNSPAITAITMRDLDDPEHFGPEHLRPDHLRTVVRDRIVLIGETAPSNWGDVHATPLGNMPGVLIHANSLLSASNLLSHEATFNWMAFLFGLTAYVLVGSIAVAPWFRLRAAILKEKHVVPRPAWPGVCALILLLILVAVIGPLLEGHVEAAEPLKLSMEVTGVLLTSAVFALQNHLSPRISRFVGLSRDTGSLLTFLVAALVVTSSLTMFWFIGGSLLLSEGMRVGSLVPVLATSAEALIKAGQHVTEPIHKKLRSLSVRAAAVMFCGSLSAAAGAAGAPPPQPSTQAVPPGLVVRSLQAFRDLLLGSSTASSPRLLAGERHRGEGVKQALQWLQQVPADGAFLLTATSGLCVVWTGGTPPYLVSLTTQAGDALGAVRSDTRLAQFPSFTMPSEPVSIVVGDAQDQEITAVLRPASALPPPLAAAAAGKESPTVEALTLFVEGGPAWRMEATRRLARLAGADANANRALLDLRVAADRSP